ncbi:unnamed protein product, partial [marine sediment metagenome]
MYSNPVIESLKIQYPSTGNFKPSAKNFLLYDFWSGNVVNEDVFAY